MLPKGYRNPASPSASQLFWGVIVSRLTLVVAALVGFMLPPLATGHLLPARRDTKGYIVTVLVLWFGLGLFKRRYLLMQGFMGSAVGLVLGTWYVHLRTR